MIQGCPSSLSTTNLLFLWWSFLQVQRTCINHHGALISLDQWFSNSTCIRITWKACESSGSWVPPWMFDSVGLWWGLRMCISNKAARCAGAAGPRTTFETHRPGTWMCVSLWVLFSQGFSKFNVHVNHLEIPLTGSDSVGLGRLPRFCLGSSLFLLNCSNSTLK